MKWLREKKRVRKAADRANAALDQLAEQTRQLWPSDLKSAYEKLAGASGGNDPPPKLSEQVRPVKRADDDAWRARMDAEKTFDEAERQLSTSMAREGCRKAIYSWEVHEKAIRLAERLIPSPQA